MTCPAIVAQSSHVTHHACSQGIQVNVARQFQQVGIVLTDDRLISILKEMAMPLVSQVKVDNITGKQFSHTPGNRLASGPN
jgi:hypothetical protein